MIANTVLANTETSIIASANSCVVVSILFYNADTVDRTVTCYAYPFGGSAGNGTTIFKVTIPSNDTFIWSSDEKLLLQDDAVLSAVADVAAKVTATVNYLAV